MFVSGLSGSGKTTIAETVPNAVDGDLFGFHSFDDKYIIPDKTVSWLIDHLPDLIFCGVCRNWSEPQNWKSHTNHTHKAEALATLKWDKKFFLWYDPLAPGERERRFGSSRENNYGKDDDTFKEIVKFSEHTKKGGLPDGFERVDCTGWTSADLTAWATNGFGAPTPKPDADDDPIATNPHAVPPAKKELQLLTVITDSIMLDQLVSEFTTANIKFALNEPDPFLLLSLVSIDKISAAPANTYILYLDGTRPLPAGVAERVIAVFSPEMGSADLIDYVADEVVSDDNEQVVPGAE